MVDDSDRLVMTVQASRGDSIRVGMELMRASRFAVGFGVFQLTLVAFALVVGAPLDVWGVPLVVATLFLTGVFVAPFQWLAVRRRPELIIAPMHIEADDAGLAIAMAAVRSQMAWSTFKSFLESGSAYVLQTGVTSHFIPKRGMTQEQERAFRVLLLRHHPLESASSPERWARSAAFGIATGIVFIVLVNVLPR